MAIGQIPWNKGRTGVYSEETIKRISETHKGMHHTEESKKKMSETRKGKMTGEKHPFFGKHHSEETKRKLAEKSKGRIHSEEARKKNSEGHKKLLQDPKIREKHLEILCFIRNDPEIQKRRGQRISESKIGHSVSEETRRKISATKLEIPIEEWKGFSHNIPYCDKFDFPFRDRVRAFFGYACVECGTIQTRKKLDVHHVHGKKDSCCSENVPRYFVPLCKSCHMKTHFNRKYWISHFTEIINQYYDGKCFFTKEEMAQLRGNKL